MEEEYSTVSLGKSIVAYRNGDYTRSYTMTLKSNVSHAEFQRELALRFDLQNALDVRIFNNQGIELFRTDLVYLKNKDVIYVSKGEEFDRASSLAEYTIIKRLGEGGFGVVELGEHKVTKSKVAIKTIFNPDANAALAFSEAETLKSLGHKNIVRLYDCIPSKNMRVIFIMEYLEGGELLEYVLGKGRLGEEEARVFFQQIAEAMVYCHDRKVIHRDLKLENVLLVTPGGAEVKVVDFGIAGLGSNLSSSKNDTGTLRYLSPEVLKNQSKMANPAQDVWAMGVMLYAMAFGTLPFNGDSDDAIISNICRGAPPFPKDSSFELRDLLSKIFMADQALRPKAMDVYYHPWTQGRKMAEQKQVEEGKAFRFEEEKKVAVQGKKGTLPSYLSPIIGAKKQHRKQASVVIESRSAMQSPKSFMSPVHSPNRGRSPKPTSNAPRLMHSPSFQSTTLAVLAYILHSGEPRKENYDSEIRRRLCNSHVISRTLISNIYDRYYS